MNQNDWDAWCKQRRYKPEALRPLFPAYLPDHQVRFSLRSSTRKGGVLDVQPSIGHIVPGMVFEVDEEGWAALDQKEGAPAVYRRVARQCLTLDGRQHSVITYEVVEDRRESFVRPSAEYVKIVVEGLHSFDLSASHIEEAAENRPDSPVDALFVYGTLMRGERRHENIGDAHCILLAEAYGLLFDCGDYPALQMAEPEQPACWVQGEFVRLPEIERRLPLLDGIEGFAGYGKSGSLFRRALIEVGMADGHTRIAWAYLADSAIESRPALMPSGDWRLHHGRKEKFLKRLAAVHCAGLGEDEILRRLVNRGPFPPADERAEIEALRPLWRALERHAISERELAQASGQWLVTPNIELSLPLHE